MTKENKSKYKVINEILASSCQIYVGGPIYNSYAFYFYKNIEVTSNICTYVL